MKKLIEKIKAFYRWMGTDGMLHALVNYNIMVTVYPIFSNPSEGAIVASLLAGFVSLAKEIYDAFTKDVNIKDAWHDVICDGIGMGMGVMTWLLWWLCNL